MVLATRQQLRLASDSWLRGACKDAGLPLIAAKTGTVADCMKAMRTVAGFDPSPGDIFGDMFGFSERAYLADPVRGLAYQPPPADASGAQPLVQDSGNHSAFQRQL